MSPDPLVAAPAPSIREAAVLIADRRLSRLPLVEDDVLVGIVTESDMIARVIAPARSIEAPLGDVMTRAPLAVDADERVFELLSLMTRRRVSHVPVTYAGRVVGVVTHGDIVRRRAGDLLDAWETVSGIHLARQARQVRLGERPDNHVDPGALSRLERERLRDALVAVRDIQAALANRHATLGR